MISRMILLSVSFVALAIPAQTAEEAPKSRMKDVLKARIAEDAKKADAKKTPAAATPATSKSNSAPDGSPAAETPQAPPAAQSHSNPSPSAKQPATDSPTVLPKVEVKKGRITELDQKLAKQEQDIARERKNLKTSEVDAALNDAKIAQPLAIFGGESSQFRKRVASERVELMEAEKDLIEAIARARTKAEKQELQKQLNELKAVRRELEKSLR
jgi:hypothetical protein